MTTAKGAAFDTAARADLARLTLRRFADERGESLASLSRLVGRNAAYLQQYLERGSPKSLPDDVRQTLARYLRIDERLLGAHDPYQPTATTPAPLRDALDRFAAFRAAAASGAVIDTATGLTLNDLDRIVSALHDRLT